MISLCEVGMAIRNRRELLGLSRERFAELCDLSDRCIGNIERGTSNVKLNTLLRISFALNEDVCEILGYYKRNYYVCTEYKTHQKDVGVYTSYGISTKQGNAIVKDVDTRPDKVDKIVKLLNKYAVSEINAKDVIEDMIAE